MAAVTANTNDTLSSFWSPKTTDIKSLKVYFSPKQEGTGDPSPSNVRPITGWTGVEVYKSGINLAKIAVNAGWVSKGYSNGITYTENADGSVHAVGTSTDKSLSAISIATTTNQQYIDNRCKIVYPPGTYTICNLAGERIYTQIRSSDTKRSIATKITQVGENTTVTISEPAIIYIRIDIASGKTVNTDCYVMFIRGTDAPSSFIPYYSTKYSVSWQSEHGTIYGGYVDLVSGELVQTWGSDYADKNTTWGFGATGASSPSAPYRAYYKISDSKEVAAQMIYSDILAYTDRYYPEAFHANINANKRFTIGLPSEISTRALFDDWLDSVNGLTIYYELVEPITYQLTPQQIKTLVGRNNIWSNADSVEIEYEYVESPELILLKKRIVQNEPHLVTGNE